MFDPSFTLAAREEYLRTFEYKYLTVANRKQFLEILDFGQMYLMCDGSQTFER